jgi:exodeoxyribonuclease VII large subunit
VLCGIGHETDVTLADFAADLRAPTPTAAAELAAPARLDCLARLQALADALQQGMRRGLDGRRQRTDHAALRLARPTELLRRQAHRLAMLQHRLAAAMRLTEFTHAQGQRQSASRLRRAAAMLLGQHGQRLAALAARLEALAPQRVLARGYAWLSDEHGDAVMSTARVAPGQRITATLADGQLRATVLAVDRTSPGKR